MLRLNSIVFTQAVVSWNVTIDNPFTIDQSYIDGLDSEQSDWLSAFPDKMKEFQKQYKKASPNLDPNAYYIFLIKGQSFTKSGFMPFKRKFGYIFVDKTQDVTTTIAHELGHGAFRLRHTFSKEAFLAAEGSTDNLMDYNRGTVLKKYQWDLVRDREAIVSWLEGDEESEFKSLLSSKYVYLHHDLSTKAYASKKGKDEFTQDAINVVDSNLYKLDTAEVKTFIYFAYIWFDQSKISRFDELVDRAFDHARDSVTQNLGERNFNLLAIVNCKYDTSLANGLKTVSFREKFYPMNGLSKDCTKSINDYVNSSWKKTFVTGLDEALKERASILSDRLKGCKIIANLPNDEDEQVSADKRAVAEGTLEERFEMSQKLAIQDAISAVGNEDNAACNLCTRAAFYYMTGSSILFPKVGSCFDDFEGCKAGAENYLKGLISGDGQAANIVADFDNLANNELKNYFVQEISGSTETTQEFWQRLQDKADNGKFIIGTYPGHVFMVVAGGMIDVVKNNSHTDGHTIIQPYKSNPNTLEGDKYGFCFTEKRGITRVPRILECGINVKVAEAPLYANIDYNGATTKIKWFRYIK